jgi:hypothetical protein
MKCCNCRMHCYLERVETTSGIVTYGVCKHMSIDRQRFPKGMLIGRDLDVQPWLCPLRGKDE